MRQNPIPREPPNKPECAEKLRSCPVSGGGTGTGVASSVRAPGRAAQRAGQECAATTQTFLPPSACCRGPWQSVPAEPLYPVCCSLPAISVGIRVPELCGPPSCGHAPPEGGAESTAQRLAKCGPEGRGSITWTGRKAGSQLQPQTRWVRYSGGGRGGASKPSGGSEVGQHQLSRLRKSLG